MWNFKKPCFFQKSIWKFCVKNFLVPIFVLKIFLSTFFHQKICWYFSVNCFLLSSCKSQVTNLKFGKQVLGWGDSRTCRTRQTSCRWAGRRVRCLWSSHQLWLDLKAFIGLISIGAKSTKKVKKPGLSRGFLDLGCFGPACLEVAQNRILYLQGIWQGILFF